MIPNRSDDLVGKLLANENITIIRKVATAASFDTKQRVLTIPLWENMTPEIEKMLISHEVSHALFTDHESWQSVVSNKEFPFSYLNIIEDARVERLMKNKYPGIKKTFFSGYRDMIDSNICKFDQNQVPKMNLIDRINMYFKFGVFFSDIEFSQDEMEFVNRCSSITTIEEAITLARDIYEYSKDQQQSKDEDDKPGLNPESNSDFDDAPDSDEDDSDSDFDPEDDDNIDNGSSSDSSESDDSDDEYDDNKDDKTSGSSTPGKGDQSLDSMTDDLIQSSLDEHLVTSGDNFYLDVCDHIDYDPIAHYKTVLNDFNKVDVSFYLNEDSQQDFDQFMNNTRRVVSYLAKEFEMKKAARGYKRSKIAKSGSIDVNKLFSYQINDEIFRRIQSHASEKNHGMIFLLDWSSSMSSVIDETIKQTIQLVMFCKRIGIPFEVYGFSSNYFHNLDHSKVQDSSYHPSAVYGNNTVEKYVNKHSDGYARSEQDFALINFFSSKMSDHELNSMIRHLVYFKTYKFASGYRLGNTPLNDSLLFMLNYINQFKKTYQTEKLSLVLLTDGASNSLDHGDLRAKPYGKTLHYVYNKTRTSYCIDGIAGRTTTQALIRFIKDRYPTINIIGFHLVSKRTNDIRYAWLYNLGHVNKYGRFISDETASMIRSNMVNQGVHILLNNETAHDKLFFVELQKSSSDSEIDITEKDTSRGIAKKLTKMIGRAIHSRVLLDQFIQTIV